MHDLRRYASRSEALEALGLPRFVAAAVRSFRARGWALLGPGSPPRAIPLARAPLRIPPPPAFPGENPLRAR